MNEQINSWGPSTVFQPFPRPQDVLVITRVFSQSLDFIQRLDPLISECCPSALWLSETWLNCLCFYFYLFCFWEIQCKLEFLTAVLQDPPKIFAAGSYSLLKHLGEERAPGKQWCWIRKPQEGLVGMRPSLIMWHTQQRSESEWGGPPKESKCMGEKSLEFMILHLQRASGIFYFNI